MPLGVSSTSDLGQTFLTSQGVDFSPCRLPALASGMYIGISRRATGLCVFDRKSRTRIPVLGCGPCFAFLSFSAWDSAHINGERKLLGERAPGLPATRQMAASRRARRLEVLKKPQETQQHGSNTFLGATHIVPRHAKTNSVICKS